MNLYKHLLYATCFCLSLTSCSKLLDTKPDKALLVPVTLADFRTILDNTENTFNFTPGFQLIASDDYYTDESGLLPLPPYERNSYLWSPDIYEGNNLIDDWIIPYQQVFYCNIVLEGLDQIKSDSKDVMLWREIRATALFHRAFAFYNLAQNFAQVYNKQTAAQVPGVAIRLNSNVNEKSRRATLQNTYDQITSDLLEAQTGLPLSTSQKTRPDRPAGYALLARIYLSMENYAAAEKYADSCLNLKNTLLDYNTIDTLGTARPFPSAPPTGAGNPEVLFYSTMPLYNFPVVTTLARIDTNLYRLYHHNDLRKVLFFRKVLPTHYTFRGTYSGTVRSYLFSGLAIDEMYLIRAECYARRVESSLAMDDLNKLLVSRWKKNQFVPLVAVTPEEALSLILVERRKELVARGLRWTDLRRLNKDPQQAITLRRVIGGKEYLLPPNDNRYVFQLPNDELSESMVQNER